METNFNKPNPKKILGYLMAFVMMVFFTNTTFAQCDHTLTMMDSYGDGWNGASVDVSVNGAIVASGACTGSSDDLVFSASDGDAINLSWTSGSYDSEISFDLKDGSGTSIASGIWGDDPAAVAACGTPSTCALDEVTVTLYDSYGDGGGSITVDGNVLTNSGTSNSMVVCIDLSTCVDVIYAATDSWSSENSWDVVDASGAVIASGGNASGQVGTCGGGSGCALDEVTLTLYDSYGDGGGSITVDGTTYTLASGSSNSWTLCLDLSGCLDFVYAATDSWSSENSWDVTDAAGTVLVSGANNSALLGNTPGFDCAGNCLSGDQVTLTMYDSYGDGGGMITIDGVDYELLSGSSNSWTICIDLAVCTDVIYSATDSWSYENSWDITDASGAILASGGDASGTVGTCIVLGCTDPVACNYDASANTDDGSCTYAAMYYDCAGNCINDADGDGICDENEIPGCTDPAAFNYDPAATDDDGSCVPVTLGCIDPAAINYCSTCNTDDGTCVYAGCTDPAADNYDANASVDDGSCTYSTVSGCTDPLADNYDANATVDDGSCTYTCTAKPTGLNVWDVTDTRFRLGWDNMNSPGCKVLKYNVRYRETGTTQWTTRSAGAGNGLCNFGLNNTNKLMINFLPNTTYDIRLRVQYCGTGGAWSAWTSTINVTMADLCPDLTNVTVQTFNGQQNKAKIMWDTTGVYEFARLYTRPNTFGATWTVQGGFGIYYPTFFKNLFTFTPGETYRVQANSFCSATLASYRGNLTPPVIWTQPGGSSKIEGGVAINNLDVYPNPSRDVFNVTFTSDDVQDLEVRVLNIVGEVVYTENLEQFVGEYTKAIDLATYTNGVYFLEITTNDGVVNKKLILQ